MRNQKKVIFVPGFSGVDGDGWPEWLRGEFIKCGFDFSILPMPDIMYPEVHQWVDFLKAQKIKVNKNTYFIGHSLGCITIARFLATLPGKTSAGGCVFVAGFDSLPKIPLLVGFCSLPLDFSTVKKHMREAMVILSDNDPLIPNKDTLDFASKVGAGVIVEHNKGHFKADIKELPSVLNTILEMDQMRQEMVEIKRLRKA